jgi:hypothetical protein
MAVIAALGSGNVGAWCHGVPSRGSNTITGVSVDRRPAYASRFGSGCGCVHSRFLTGGALSGPRTAQPPDDSNLDVVVSPV